MFTGIIQTKAKVLHIQKSASEARFQFAPVKMFKNIVKGESIAINGVCLTVETFDDFSFSAYASTKTLELTNLGFLKTSSYVNCERALALGDRLGGHIVTGHVDDLAILQNIEEKLSSKICTFQLPNSLQGLVISQGSVCLDGISLTVSELDKTNFKVNIIPETWQETTAQSWKIYDKINIESDIIGKYVHSRTLSYTQTKEEQNSKLTESYLKELGF